jgi:hypothetical protein
MMDNEVQIEVQIAGNWQSASSTLNDPQIYLAEMKSVQKMYPGLRVRTVDREGRLLDMIG